MLLAMEFDVVGESDGYFGQVFGEIDGTSILQVFFFCDNNFYTMNEGLFEQKKTILSEPLVALMIKEMKKIELENTKRRIFLDEIYVFCSRLFYIAFWQNTFFFN